MTVREYIGARYVPLFMGEWSSENAYEPLSIVMHEGASYTSRQAVPVGISITDETYWALSGNYNAQVEAYRQEVQTFDNRITANEEGIDNLETDLADATQQLNNSIANETSARQQADTTLSNSITAITNDVSELTQDLQSETTNRENGDSLIYSFIDTTKTDIIQNYHKTTFDNTQNTYVDFLHGNDDTAEIWNMRKPFKTLAAAFEAVSDVGNDLRFTFLSNGTYTMPVREIIGSVLHLTAAAETDSVTVVIDSPYGNFYAYDCHINLRSDNTNARLNFEISYPGKASRKFEMEGSTLWVNRANITCDKLYLIQGSAAISNCTLNSVASTVDTPANDSFLDFWFSMVRFYNVTINNTLDHHALHMMVGKLRIENMPFHIASNSAVSGDKSAIYLQDSTIRLNNDFKIGANSTYGAALQANSSIIFGSDTYYNNWASQTRTGNLVADGTIRSKTTNVIPVS